MYRLYRIYHPEIFQGKNQKKNYFEGWYYKVIDKNKEHALAIIPGISIEKEDPHAFIQILDHQNKTNYFRYDISEFRFHEKRFEIMIGDNYFSRDRIRLNILEKGTLIQGELRFDHIISLPKTILRPGIMGPYSFIPIMECYHGIISIHHEIEGKLNLSGNPTDFTNGYGYIEKDWGKSFPEKWIWFQSNHFGSSGVTLMFSVAKIPWFRKSFTGFISFLRLKGRIYVFATYTGAKLKRLSFHGNSIFIILEDLRFRMEVRVSGTDGGTLMAPRNGLMKRKILESINGVVTVRFFTRQGELIYEGTGYNTGLEIVLQREE
jgi:hypothetical protein